MNIDLEVLFDNLIAANDNFSEFHFKGVRKQWILLPDKNLSDNEDDVGIPWKVIDKIRHVVDSYILHGGLCVLEFRQIYEKVFKEEIGPRKYGFFETRDMLSYLDDLGFLKLYQESGVQYVYAEYNLARKLEKFASQGHLDYLMKPGDTMSVLPFFPDVGETIKFLISEIFAIRLFYIILDSVVPDFELMNQRMTDFYQLHSMNLILDEEDVQIGLMVAVQLKSSGFWYRGQIVKMPQVGVVTVCFVDDGTLEDFRIKDLRHLSLRFKYMPALGIPAALYGLDFTGRSRALKNFVSMVCTDVSEDNENPDENSVPKMYKGVVKRLALSSKHPLQIVLYDENGTNINQELVKSGSTGLRVDLKIKLTQIQRKERMKKELLNQYIEELSQDQVKNEEAIEFLTKKLKIIKVPDVWEI